MKWIKLYENFQSIEKWKIDKICREYGIISTSCPLLLRLFIISMDLVMCPLPLSCIPYKIFIY